MACRIATTRAACALGAALLSALIVSVSAPAQTVPPSEALSPLSKACQAGSAALADESPLPNVTTALKQRKTLRILVMGTAPGRVGARATVREGDRRTYERVHDATLRSLGRPGCSDDYVVDRRLGDRFGSLHLG